VQEIFSLANKSALITGATGYLGEIMALSLAKSGVKVYINGTNKEKVDRLIAKINLNAEPAIFDVTNEDQVKNFFNSISNESIDILVNNAYFGNSGSIETSTNQDYLSSYDITVIAAQNIVKSAMPMLKQACTINGQASVINITSMYGMVSPDINIYESKKQSNPPFYGAAKAALIQWTKYAACEFAEYGIRFNSISPGAFPDITKQNKDLINKIEKKVPMRRVGRPEELIGALIFLASNSSSYVTGSNIVVDGGWTAW
jgi:NAD(P)-dependent dehydrogenase (short-subunit alcohol dehydrogenase family)